MPRAVFDPNVLIAGLISPRGAPAALVVALSGGRFELVVSPALLDELERVLAREKFRRYITPAEARTYVEAVRRLATEVDDPRERETGLTPDPGDDYLVALARSSEADVLVSGDPHLTGLTDPRPPVVTPRAFLDEIGEA